MSRLGSGGRAFLPARSSPEGPGTEAPAVSRFSEGRMRQIITLDVGGDANRSYLILDRSDGTAWCVDPSYGATVVLETCRRAGCTLREVLLTHTHADHIATVPDLQKVLGVRVWVHRNELSRMPGALALPGEGPLDALSGLEVVETPGHTPGGVCYRVDDALFTGDVLFVDWVGRWDLPGGDGRALFRSLAKLRTLPPHLVIHPGHHYGCQETRSLGEELLHNTFFACDDYERFAAMLPELTA